MLRPRRRLAWALFAATALAALPARAAPPSPAAEGGGVPSEPRRDGLYLALHHVAGYGTFFYHITSEPSSLPFDAQLSGPHVDLAAAIGRALRPGLGLAFEASFWAQGITEDSGDLGDTWIANGFGPRAGAALDWWPVRAAPFHARFGLGMAAAVFAAGYAEGDEDESIHHDVAFGPLMVLAAHYDLVRLSTFFFGLTSRLHTGVLVNEHSRVVPLGAAFGVSLGGF